MTQDQACLLATMCFEHGHMTVLRMIATSVLTSSNTALCVDVHPSVLERVRHNAAVLEGLGCELDRLACAIGDRELCLEHSMCGGAG